MISRAESRADLEAYAACWSAVWPDDGVSVDFMLDRLSREPERLYLNAWEDDRVVAIGFVGRSSRPGYRPVAVTVLPERRGRGLGSQLFDLCLDRARALDADHLLGFVREDDAASVGFVRRRGFKILDRVVALALELEPGAQAPVPPDGIEIVELDQTRREAAFEVYAQGVVDMPTAAPLDPGSLSDWLVEVEGRPLTLVALEGECVVGYADLEVRDAAARVAGNGMTTVVRSHRGRGIAEALKRTQIAWAASHGYRRLTTATHSDNEPMRRLNEKLGYRELPALLDVTRPL
jgi:GNAT superfamily N-acetyltransferase